MAINIGGRNCLNYRNYLFFSFKVFSEKTSNQVRYVDASGRQRMISQRMGFYAEQLANGKEKVVFINNELLATEEELRSGQEELNTILEDVTQKNNQLEKDKIILDIIQRVSEVGFWDLNAEDMVISHSGVVGELYGVGKGVKIGFVESLEYFPEKTAEEVRQAYQSAIKDRKDFELVIPFLREKKETIWVKMIGKIRVSENDEVLSVYGTLQDMSKQKEKEALESMYEQLERTVNFKSDFLAQMSLEIRTPLNGIVGAIENMDSGVEKEESEKLFSIIKDSSFDLLHIVNNVLKLSKLEAGQEKAEFVDCETENLVKSTIKLFESKANAEDTTLKLAIDNNVPSMLRIDMPRVKQVLNNLISNAIKYTKKGEVKLSVSQEEINNTDCVRFTVSDNGEGMNQNELDKIFFK